MEEKIGCCGIQCLQCPAFIATKNQDQELRKKTAQEWSALFKAEIRPEDILCVGCWSDKEPIFAHCRECDYRLCAKKRGLPHCALCADYPCEKLEQFFQMVPSAKATLETLRR